MRIIQEITAPMQASVGLNPYLRNPGVTGYGGARVDIMLTTSPRSNFPENARVYEPERDEVIYIEGGLEEALDVLRGVVRTLEFLKGDLQTKAGPRRALPCPDCQEGSPGNHTWECQAKWSEVARKILADDPKMADRQRRVAQHEANALTHADCGGTGCAECRWTGAPS